MSKQKQYTSEFKQEALRQVAMSGKSVAQVARELGVNATTLYQWRNDAISERRMPVDPQETAKQRLERENALLAEERDILKKAIAYFAEPPRK